MFTEIQAVQDPDLARIRTILVAAGPRLAALGREAALAFQRPPDIPGGPVLDQGQVIGRLMQELTTLEGEVGRVTLPAATAERARALAVRSLQETEQALARLADSYAAPDQPSATALLAESVRLLRAASATGALAGTALGIPWPLQ